ncbi:MAG TPA: hypothetical protein VLS47_07685 [Gallionella sp.]|nr:hypothetical protein [Gallionella sp.]
MSDAGRAFPPSAYTFSQRNTSSTGIGCCTWFVNPGIRQGIQQEKMHFCLNPLDSRLMELLAIRLSWQKTPAKSLVMRGNDAAIIHLPDSILDGSVLSSMM